MIAQHSLFDFVAPAARATDPITSHQAAAKQLRTGRADNDRARVLRELHTWGACSSRRLAQRSGLDRHMVARRLPELRKLGLAYTDGLEDDGSGMVWHPVGEPRT